MRYSWSLTSRSLSLLRMVSRTISTKYGASLASTFGGASFSAVALALSACARVMARVSTIDSITVFRRSKARSGCRYGDRKLGAWINPASSAASGKVTSLRSLLKYDRAPSANPEIVNDPRRLRQTQKVNAAMLEESAIFNREHRIYHDLGDVVVGHQRALGTLSRVKQRSDQLRLE